MKINWKDLFGKKRIAQLEAENEILTNMLDDCGRFIKDRKRLRIQKLKVNYLTFDDYIETPENRKFIQKELSRKLAEELCGVITFDRQFDEDAMAYKYTASVEVVL